MTERDIDTTRQGGVDIAPKHAQAAPEMSLSEAIEYDAKFSWRSVPTKSDRARQALLAEIRRLLFEAESDRELAVRQAKASAQSYRDMAAEVERLRKALAYTDEKWRCSMEELLRFRAAMPDIVGCPYCDPAPCRHDDIGFYPCCRSRRAAVRHGLLPAFERVNEEEGA